MNKTSETAIYGWSFNPPTLAHAQVVKKVLATKKISQVIISPSGLRWDKDFGINENHRRNLIEIYVDSLKREWFNVEIDRYFMHGLNGDETTTAQEEEYFREKLWNSPWFVFGTDVAPDMPTWKWNINKFIETKLKKLFLTRPWFDFDFEANNFKSYMLLDIPDMIDLSSTTVRTLINTKDEVSDILYPGVDNHLHPSVSSHIHENNITYR